MAASVGNARRWRVLFQQLCGEREGIPLTELEALISPMGGRLAEALCAQLRAPGPAHLLGPKAEVTLECFLAAVSSAVLSCASHGCVGTELLTGKPSSSVRAEDMRALLVEWGVLAKENQEEVLHQHNEAVTGLDSKLSKTVAEQARTIAKLEREKRWLIRELFQCRARGCHTSPHDTSSVDSLLL